MNLRQKLKINTPHVVHETIEGETILLDLDKGAYYSLNETGAVLWSFIENRCTRQESIEKAAAYFDGFDQKCEDAVHIFIDELLQENLVVLEESVPDEAHNSSMDSEPPGSLEAKQCFSMPAINKYTDMEDLLLLDPIHDVDDLGWPSMKSR